MSARSVERVTNTHRDTILRLLVLAGERCQRLMRERVRNVGGSILRGLCARVARHKLNQLNEKLFIDRLLSSHADSYGGRTRKILSRSILELDCRSKARERKDA